MARSKSKRDFSTRLSQEALEQLDALVRGHRYMNRTAAIEAAIDRLYRDREEERERKRAALERVAGALVIGTTPESFRRAKAERMEWEATRIIDGA